MKMRFPTPPLLIIMKFEISNINKNINNIMRIIGYQPAYFQNEGEVSIVRQLGRNDYPRFHLYIKQDKDEFIFKLHLDQKKPSYKGAKGHSGEYDGDVVEGEAGRIKGFLK